MALIVVLAVTAGLAVDAPIAQAAPVDDLLASLQPSADVNDFADLLTPAEREALEQRCRALRANSGAQLAVVTVTSMQGGQIDDFTEKLFRRWGVGDKDRDNGVMLLVSLQDRKARIEVGYGLEPVLPDALAGRILAEHLFPAFKQQQYAAGLSATVNRIAEIIERGEPAPQQLRDQPPQLGANGVVCVLIVLVLFSALPAMLMGVTLRQRQLGGVFVSGFFMLFVYFFAAASGMVLWGYLVMAIADLLAGVFGYSVDQELNRKRRRGDDSFWDGWVWGHPGSDGGSSWSGGWGGGGFGGGGGWGGFGGGSSGGGGASGGW